MDIDMPAWTSGSERQRAWATKLRQSLVDWVRLAVGLFENNEDPEQAHLRDRDARVARAMEAALRRTLAEHTDAEWWIDIRGDPQVVLSAALRSTDLSFIAVLARVQRTHWHKNATRDGR